MKVPDLIGGDEGVIRAVDGLQFATRDALLVVPHLLEALY